MILPTKGIAPNRALLAVGATVLAHLTEPKTVSRLWTDLGTAGGSAELKFDWFVLALDLLYALGLVRLDGGRLHRDQPANREDCA